MAYFLFDSCTIALFSESSLKALSLLSAAGSTPYVESEHYSLLVQRYGYKPRHKVF